MSFVFKSYLNEVTKDLNKAKKKRLRDAAKHVAKKMKKKVGKRGLSVPGQPPSKKSGSLRKGIGYEILNEDTALVGVGPPAYHAHLSEFGTTDRTRKDGKNTGRIIKRPFVVPTSQEESKAVQDILSKPLV